MNDGNKIEKYSRLSKLYDLNRIDDTGASNLRALSAAIEKGSRRLTNKFKNRDYFKQLLLKRVPCISWIKSYQLKSYILPDIMAGFTVGIMNVPQGMAYSLLATLPPVNGLYISFFPLIIYALFGTSRHLAMGWLYSFFVPIF